VENFSAISILILFSAEYKTRRKFQVLWNLTEFAAPVYKFYKFSPLAARRFSMTFFFAERISKKDKRGKRL
jgi:hypothetical protein